MDNLLTRAGTNGPFTDALAWLQIGGPVVMILLAMSVLALSILLVKLLQFRAARLGQQRPVRNALALHRGGRRREALMQIRHSPNPVAQVLAAAIRGQLRELPEAKIREEVYRLGAERLEQLRAHLRALEVIASLAPLLGLLGTVLGMIKAFQQLQAAGARVDPSVLSGGIWEALLTTAVGLAVAIPVIVIVNLLDRRLARLAHVMNDAVSQVFTERLEEEQELHDAQNIEEQPHAERAVAGRSATVPG